MKISYDNEADALYILLTDSTPVDARDVEKGITVDFDEQGHIVGLEVLSAADKLGKESIFNVSIENMPAEQSI